MQPKWRRVAKKGVMPLPIDAEGNQDIKSLRKGGPSGLVTVLLGLKWWGAAGGKAGLWEKAVHDVRLCLENLVTGPIKHKGNQASDDSRWVLLCLYFRRLLISCPQCAKEKEDIIVSQLPCRVSCHQSEISCPSM